MGSCSKDELMVESLYKWQMKGLAKGTDPSIVYEELERLQDIHGTLSAGIIVSTAKNKNSVLHQLFEWDDTKAAEKYRLHQARILLNNIKINVVSDGEAREYSVFEITCNKDGYKRIQSFDTDDVEYIKTGVLKSLTYWKEKLKLYKNFDEAIKHITNAIEALI